MAEKITAQTFPIELNELNRRVRMLEIKMDKIEERVLSLEKSIEALKNDVRILKDVTEKKVIDVRNEILMLKEKIEDFDKKIGQFVSKTEFQKVKMFIDIINPLTSNFVSKDELESVIGELKKSILKQENKV